MGSDWLVSLARTTKGLQAFLVEGWFYMAKKITKIGITGSSSNPTGTNSDPAAGKTTTSFRGTAIPKTTPAAAASKGQITQEMIALRAYEIWKSGKGSSEFENWVRAERELRGL